MREEKDSYLKFLAEFSKKIISTVEKHALPPAALPLRIEDFPNAFQETETAAPAPPSPLRRSRVTGAEESGFSEKTFLDRDDFLTLVERVCRLRDPKAQVERLDSGGALGDYLRVSVPHGEIIRVYPVGAVEYGISLEVLHSFCDQIDARYRRADSGLISYLVYGGDPAPEGLLSAATRRHVRLMSFVEYQGLIDFRTYLRKQTERLENDRIYQPRLYAWSPAEKNATGHPGSPDR